MLRILVVEDNPFCIEPLVNCLCMEGMEVFQAENGKSAMKILETQPIDWVLTDIVMPDMDGVELLVALRKRWPNMQIIAWSGAQEKELYLTIAAHLGAGTIMKKPLIPSEVIEIIKKWSEEK